MKWVGGVMSLVLCTGGALWSQSLPGPGRKLQSFRALQQRAQVWPCGKQTQSIMERQCMKCSSGKHPLWKLPVVLQEEIQILLLSCLAAGSAISLKASLKRSWKKKCSCEYKGRSKCLTIGSPVWVWSDYNLWTAPKYSWYCYFRHAGFRIEFHQLLQEKMMFLGRGCVSDCILVFLSVGLTKICIFPSKFLLLLYCHRCFGKSEGQTDR